MKFFTKRRVVRVSRNRSNVFAAQPKSDDQAVISDSAGEVVQKAGARTGLQMEVPFQQLKEWGPDAQELVREIDERNGDI